jgi:hypothetical protein
MEFMSTDELRSAIKRTQEALNEFAEADSRVESALLSSDDVRRNAAVARLEEASAEYSLALRDEVRARKQAAPSFEQLLQDTYTQFPGAEMVLESILQHAAAPAASAGTPLSSTTRVYSTFESRAEWTGRSVRHLFPRSSTATA